MAKQLTSDQIINLLETLPQRMAELTGGLTAAQLHSRSDPDTWSMNEILAHLRTCADVWGGCIQSIVTEDRPLIRAVNPRTWARSTNYEKLEFRQSFAAFASQRADLLAFLRHLSIDQWARTATVTVAGRPFERTPLYYGQWLAEHERSHVKHIERMVKTS